jgi:hypothetical protein
MGGCTVIAAIVTPIITAVNTHNPSPPVVIVHDQPQTSCPVLIEQYEAILRGNSGMIKVLVSIVTKDPDARRCGITATILDEMLGH